ncbi:hypothetical protein T12_17118 [Trichinella patagoniensis]|uniref:Uncharacterized protein n=1 Tax=Trichinella patagoniensis TaxID=990121 RepID=A0A0V0ZV25_9BILA|nr:hypothetical protein T12_17118 [Trichinella patagoniensis]
MNHQQRLCKVLMINSLLMHCKYCSMVSLLFKLYKLLIKVLENAKQNFTTHPITRRTFSQLETLAHRLDEFLNEYLPKAAGKEDMIVCHVFALLADVQRFQHSPPGM